jgi:hypothetical protein
MRPRVILKKTSYLKRQERGNSKRISKYLEKYVDEVGKAMSKNGEAPWMKQKLTTNTTQSVDSEARWLLPKERTGVFYTGGFLGDQESPGNTEPNKQKGWIKRFTSNWLKALEKNSQRRNDGFRFILGLSPETVRELTKAHISCDQAMREIWNTTIALYRERHGWTSSEDEVAWLAGAHHDTDNAHMHIMLFPTTKSGKLLRTNNNRGKEKINDLNDLIAMVNISAELYYREIMPFKFQSQELKKSLLLSPEEDPPLPTLEDFDIPNGITRVNSANKRVREREEDEQKTRERIEWDEINPLDSRKKEEMALEYGEVSFLDQIKKKITSLRAKMILGAIATIVKVWERKKIKFFPTMRELYEKKDIDKTYLKVKESFPAEEKELERLQEIIEAGIIKKEKSIERLKNITTNVKERTHAIINMAIGLRDNIVAKDAYQMSLGLLGSYEANTSPKDNEKKLMLIEKEEKKCLQEKMLENRRTIEYLSVRRSILASLRSPKKKIGAGTISLLEGALDILNQMIEGSKKVALSLEGRHLEAKSSILRQGDSISVREENREWNIKKTEVGYELLLEENVGKPFPPHLDPETVIEDLRKNSTVEIDNRAIEKTTAQITKSLAKLDSDAMEGDTKTTRGAESIAKVSNPIEIIIRSKNLKNRERRRLLKESMRRPKTLIEDSEAPTDISEGEIK